MPPAEKKDLSPTAASPTAMQTANAALETVIIFDWDDTLLASSFLSAKGYRLDNNLERSPELELQLKELEQSVVSVLTLALGFGPVHIVTNAETGWVQMSAQKFIPGVVPILSKVKVVSARSTYETMFPDSPLKWKFYAFQEKLASSFTELKSEKNVISFGDSYVEREAVRAVTKGLPNTRTKSVKFAERPSMEQLRRQIELVSNCFQYIHNHDGDLDLQLTVTVNNGSQPPSPTSSSAAQAGPQLQPHQPQQQLPPPSTPLVNGTVASSSTSTSPVMPPTTPTRATAIAAAAAAAAVPALPLAPATPKTVPKSPLHQSVSLPLSPARAVSSASPCVPMSLVPSQALFPTVAASHHNHFMSKMTMNSINGLNSLSAMNSAPTPMVRS